MRNFKKIIKITIFAVLVGIIFSICDYVFIPSGYVRVILHTLNNSEENYDCIILGASHGRSAVNPYKLDEELGTNALNLCIPSETIDDSYYLLKESCRNNDVKTVILDMDYQYWYNLVKNDFSDSFIYYQLEPSQVKMEYFFSNLLKKDFRIPFSRWTNYISDFNGIKEKVSLKQTDAYRNYEVGGAVISGADGPYVGKGFFSRNPGGHAGRGYVPRFVWNESKVDKDVLAKFKDIVDYCNDKGIKLICVTSTITPATVLTKTAENSSKFFNEITSKYEIEYYDFNLLRQDVMPRTNLDFGDWDGHMCGKLADRYSSIMASVIKEAKEGKFDRTKYLYDSYDKLYDDVNEVLYCETGLCIKKKDDSTYNVSFEVDSLAGSGHVTEYQIILGTEDGARTLSEYSTATYYAFDLPKGEYTIRVNARVRGSSAAFEEYCEKEAILN